MERNDTAAGVFAALVILLPFGLVIGFPLLGWALWAAALVGVFVSTQRRRERARATGDPHTYPTLDKHRPWDKE